MAKRTVNRVDASGLVREVEEEYDEEAEQKEQEWNDLVQSRTSQSAGLVALDDVKIMRLWGDLDLRWTNIEHGLCAAFDAMLKDEWWVTRPIYFKPLANTVRRQMVEEVCERFFFGKGERYDEFRSVLKECAARGDARNKLIHGHWGWHSDRAKESIEIVRMLEDFMHSDFKKRKFWTQNEMTAERDRMVATGEKLWAVVNPLTREKFERGLERFRASGQRQTYPQME